MLAGGHGMTELVLRGPLPTCPSGGVRAAAVTRRRPPRWLWGHDRHGGFRTRAGNSVITVRGTTWYVSDRCVGLGAGAVEDRRRGRHFDPAVVDAFMTLVDDLGPLLPDAAASAAFACQEQETSV